MFGDFSPKLFNSVNKIKMIQEMFYLGSDSEDKEICNV